MSSENQANASMTTNNNPLVSVVVTSFNQRELLIKTVRSVLDQTYDNLEIIIADDHSTDDTDLHVTKIIQASKYPIKYIKQPHNVGIPANRNSALKLINGDFFTILDGDDLYLPENIQKMVEKAAMGYDAVYTNLEFIDEYDKHIVIRDSGEMPEGHISHVIGLGLFGIMRNMLFPSSFLQAGGMMDERLPRYDGYDFTFRVSLTSKIGYISKPLAKYRVYQGSDSQQLKTIDHYNDYIIIRKNIIGLLRKTNALETPRKNEIIRSWDLRLFQYWLRLPSMQRLKSKGFFIALLLSYLFGPNRIQVKASFAEFKKIFLIEKHNSA